MKTRIDKRGNGLTLHIQKPSAEEAGLRENSAVDVAIQTGKFVVTTRELTPSLKDLVGSITLRNRHAEVKTGKAVGNEVR